MLDIFTYELINHRSLEEVCAELRAAHEKRPDPSLARKIVQLETEIAVRKGRPSEK